MTATATVARGRTVVIERTEYRSGAEVTLSAGEIAWLRDLGFLVDPNKVIPPPPKRHQDRMLDYGGPAHGYVDEPRGYSPQNPGIVTHEDRVVARR